MRVHALALAALLVACGVPALDQASPRATPLSRLTAAPAPTPSASPSDCRRWEGRLPLEPVGVPSPIAATVQVEEDPGISAPIYAVIRRLPITIVVGFDAPVDPATFALGLARLGHCLYFREGVTQRVEWRSDTEARVTVERIEVFEVGLTFGRGRDRDGREVREPKFQLAYEATRDLRAPSRIVRMPLDGSAERVVSPIDDSLTPVSVSPDGRRALLVRQISANTSDHSFIRIPYVLELATGRRTAFRRTTVDFVGGVRWERDRVWVSKWERLALDGSGRQESFGDRIPAGAGEIADAAVSRDLRWLAAVRTSSAELSFEGAGVLTIVDLRTGAVRSPGLTARYLRHPGGSFAGMLDWSPQGELLVTSYLGTAERYARATYQIVDTGTLSTRRLSLPSEGVSAARWSPAGSYIDVLGHGVVRRDGTRVVPPSATFPFGLWTPDDRFFLTADDTQTFELVEIATGRRTAVPLPADSFGGLGLLGLAGDGSALFVWR